MSELKHTPGPWIYTREDQQVHLPNDHSKLIADIRGWGWIQKLPNAEEIQDANGELIAEAGTVASECGLTPRQLLEQRDDLNNKLYKLHTDMVNQKNELLEAVKYARRFLNPDYCDVYYIDDLIKKYPHNL